MVALKVVWFVILCVCVYQPLEKFNSDDTEKTGSLLKESSMTSSKFFGENPCPPQAQYNYCTVNVYAGIGLPPFPNYSTTSMILYGLFYPFPS